MKQELDRPSHLIEIKIQGWRLRILFSEVVQPKELSARNPANRVWTSFATICIAHAVHRMDWIQTRSKQTMLGT